MSEKKAWAKKAGWSVASVLSGGLGCVLVLYLYIASQLPEVHRLTHVSWQAPLQVYSHEGLLMGEFGQKHRIPVTIDQVPQSLIHAVLATEDQRFYDHNGVDFIGLVRASIKLIATGKKAQGASTITMQVARNFFLGPEKTYTRKLREILLAIKIDRVLTKDQILELYLNKIYFGQRAYGVAAAARHYYGCKLESLTLPQMAMIAGLPKAPSRINPLANPERALDRRNHVLSRMLEHHYIDQATYDKAVQVPLTAKHFGTHIALKAPYAAEMVRRAIHARLGEKAYTEGFKVYTTIDARTQRAANRALTQGLLTFDAHHGWRTPTHHLSREVGEELSAWQKALATYPTLHGLVPTAVLAVDDEGADLLEANGHVIHLQADQAEDATTYNTYGYHLRQAKPLSSLMKAGDVVTVQADEEGVWRLKQTPVVQGALVASRRHTGEVLAVVGGWSFRQSHFNRVSQAWRQPGSCIKPFLYAAAIDQGYTMASMINDAPVVMPDSGENALWRPQNAGMRFHGPTRLRDGLTHSRNLVSVRLLRAIGIDYGRDYLKRFGFDIEQQPKGLSMALGAGMVTPWQLNQAMAVFAQSGQLIPAKLIEHVVDQQGKDWTAAFLQLPLTDQTAPTQPQTILAPDSAFLMHTALTDVIQHGTGRRAKVLHRHDLAGKTGTTNKDMDAWFSGYGGQVIATVWVGYDDTRNLHAYGSQVALPIWINFMGQVLRDQPVYHTEQPSTIVTARIDPHTGLLADGHDEHSRFEYFRQGHEPTAASEQDTNPSEQARESLLHQLY